MFERLSDRARKVMALANQEAQRFNHEYIGTEHILLGLLDEGKGVAANVLKNLEVNLCRVRLEVEGLVKSSPDRVTMGKLPQTPRAKKVIEYAIEEARELGHDYIGTEHLLLGLLRERDGIAAQVLMNFGLELDGVRKEIVDLLGVVDQIPNPDYSKSAGYSFTEPMQQSVRRWQGRTEKMVGEIVSEAAGEANSALWTHRSPDWCVFRQELDSRLRQLVLDVYHQALVDNSRGGVGG
jgi:ATP-dependent Clp protease ATP-binding subunit ClpA